MPDILMCANEDCHIKEKCYRYTAIANHYGMQSYGDFNYKDNQGKCFWDNKDRKNKIIGNLK